MYFSVMLRFLLDSEKMRLIMVLIKLLLFLYFHFPFMIQLFYQNLTLIKNDTGAFFLNNFRYSLYIDFLCSFYNYWGKTGIFMQY